jgi:serine/threonine-protein kinase HipA
MSNKILKIKYKTRDVGTLLYSNNLVSFQYDNQWISNGFSISPLSLPLTNKIFTPSFQPFEGMFGIFNDSLPDGWGRLIVDRMLRKKSINPNKINPLYRLSIVGNSSMGALEYIPNEKISQEIFYDLNLDIIKNQCDLLLNNQEINNLDYLFNNGASSGGTRPKIFKKIYKNIYNEDWIIKFPSSYDSSDIGIQEYNYSICARKCGIEVPEIKLFDSNQCSGYFGIKRFDRTNKEKIHMASVSALLETSHTLPNLDYSDLLKLTFLLTKDVSQVKGMFTLMCFNVYSHNRDDHSKNFTFLYDKKWKLAPAYDLTYSNSINGEHATTIAGSALYPTKKHLLKVGKDFGLTPSFCKEKIDQIEDLVKTDLTKYLIK